jgi:hypothetical protein
LYNTAGEVEGTPKRAFEYAIEKMKEINYKKNSNLYYQEASIIKIIDDTVDYIDKPVFS